MYKKKVGDWKILLCFTRRSKSVRLVFIKFEIDTLFPCF